MDTEFKALSDKIDILTERVIEVLKLPSRGKFVYMSPEIDQLATALSLAQKTYTPIVDLKKNFYTDVAYASLQQVIDATRPSLCENGLSVTQVLFDHENEQLLHTKLLHNSGQFIESQMRVKPNSNEGPVIVSYINLMKRTAYAALVGCCIPKEDDDAVIANKQQRKIVGRGSAAKREDFSYEPITVEQYEQLVDELEGFPELAQQLLVDYEIDDIKELKRSLFSAAIGNVRKNILILKGNT